MGLKVIKQEYFEADDLIANYSSKLSKNNNITIISSDKDLYQLINENVSIYDPMKKKYFSKVFIGFNFKMIWMLKKNMESKFIN
jgi:DNA polymerase I